MTSLYELFTARTHPSPRKLRLFAVACCRRVFNCPLLDLAEQLAEGTLSDQDREAAELEALQRHIAERERPTAQWSREAEYATRAVLLCLADGPFQALDAASYARRACRVPHGQGHRHDCEEEAVQCEFFREVFGPPIRFDPVWMAANDRAAVALAHTIYTEQAWDLAPILADALEDGGCDVAAILNHLRQPIRHVRGCWVVDDILGRE